MNENLDSALTLRYPKIFRNRYGSMSETAMCWGFEHGDGWYNIIDKLCANIQGHINQSRRRRLDALLYNRALSRAIKGDMSSYNRMKSWIQKSIDEDLLDPEPQLRLVPEACTQVVASQVKEKFGTLRFYYSGGDEVVHGMVDLAESMSGVTCEVCGKPGTVRGGGWIQTLCDEHSDGREPAEMGF